MNFKIRCSHQFKIQEQFNLFGVSYPKQESLVNRHSKVEQEIYLSLLIAPCEINEKVTKNLNQIYKKVAKIINVYITCLAKRSLENLSKPLYVGKSPTENSGGSRYGNHKESKKQSLRMFLSELPFQANYYGRENSK